MLVVAEEGAQANIVESYIGLGENTYLTSSVAEVYLEANANVSHYRVQRESTKAFHVSNIEVVQEKDSNFSTHTFSFGGKLVRNEVNPVLDGENIFSGLYGLNILNKDQHIDNTTVIDHAKPHCESDEQYRGVYADKSEGVFSGTIIVRQDAQKTNAIQ